MCLSGYLQTKRYSYYNHISSTLGMENPQEPSTQVVQAPVAVPIKTLFTQKPITKLVFGATGIYVCYLISAVLNQKILRQKYKPFNSDHEEALFSYPIIFLLVPNLIGFLIGKVANFTQTSKTQIPAKNMLKITTSVLISGLAFNMAIMYLQFPIVVLVKSCNILPVMLVGVFCSRIKDNKKMKLGKEKLIVGVLVTAGVIMFFWSSNVSTIASTQGALIGFVLVIVSVIADGFLPDFQAEVRHKFKPKPMQLYEKICLWVFVFSLAYSVCTLDLFRICEFARVYPSLILDIVSEGLMSSFGYMFVVYLVFHFRQHVAPFVVTSRKIVSAIVSILVFKHPVNFSQWLGICLVIFGIVLQLVLTRVIRWYRKAKETKSYDII